MNRFIPKKSQKKYFFADPQKTLSETFFDFWPGGPRDSCKWSLGSHATGVNDSLTSSCQQTFFKKAGPDDHKWCWLLGIASIPLMGLEAQQRYFSYRAMLVAIVSQNCFFVLVFMGYRTIIARYVAKWGIARMCLCKIKYQGGGIAPFWGSAPLP